MKNKLTILVAVILGLTLLAYMLAYQVRYNEVVVQTTFEKASAINRDPGLYWKWPWPIQNIHRYSTRVQLLDDTDEELTTADAYSVIVRSYIAWKIEDPEKFFVSLQDVDRAQKALQPLLKDTKAIISRYRFDQLVNTDASAVKLQEIEETALKQMTERLSQQSYGIKVEHVGIRRIVLPEKATDSVFGYMRATRERLAADTRASGQARAVQIRTQATAAKSTILSFANSRAKAIEAEGINQSTKSFEVFKQDQEFAIFLDKLDAVKKMLAHNTTLVLDARGPLDIFSADRNEPAPSGGK